jgi:hypothetical protein
LFQSIHEKRKTSFPLLNGIHFTTVFPKHFIPSFYLCHERSYLFLWKQLLGLEKFELSTEDSYLMQQIFSTRLQKVRLGSVSFQTLVAKFTQIHLLCALLDGNLLLHKSHWVISSDTLRLIRLFLNQIPHYDQLLKKHPELPMLYEAIWHNTNILVDS